MALIYNKHIIKTAIAEPSNRHEEKESSFRPGFTLLNSWCLDEEVILTRPGHAWVISSKSRAPLYHTWGPKSRQREEIGDMWRGPADKECHVWNGKSEICRSWDLENFKCGGRRISRGWLRWHSEFTDMIVRWQVLPNCELINISLQVAWHLSLSLSPSRILPVPPCT